MKKSKIKEKNKNIKPITINIERDEEDGNPTFKVENCFYGESFLKYHFVDDKELTRYIKKVEFMVRSSNEYKAFIGYLKQELSINHCTILNKLNDSTVSVEMHHIPFTLYDIVNTIILFYLSKEKGFNTFSIASDVMRLHYENMIGLVPLSKTIHELVHSEGHSSNIFIHRDFIFGNIELFYKNFSIFMPDEIKQKYINLMELSKERIDLRDSIVELQSKEMQNFLLDNMEGVNNTLGIKSIKNKLVLEKSSKKKKIIEDEEDDNYEDED